MTVWDTGMTGLCHGRSGVQSFVGVLAESGGRAELGLGRAHAEWDRGVGERASVGVSDLGEEVPVLQLCVGQGFGQVQEGGGGFGPVARGVLEHLLSRLSPKAATNQSAPVKSR